MSGGIIESWRRDKRPLFPLRINSKTVVFVTEEKCNENYANELRRKYNNSKGHVSTRDMSFYY